jgi:hypothetical protein
MRLRWWGPPAIVGIGLLVGACGIGPEGATTGSPTLIAQDDVSVGLCHAIAGLPDPATVKRTFANEAHDGLHRLAADGRLTAPMTARVLEAMQRVEADLGASPPPPAISGDLVDLKAAADAALQALGVEMSTCGP